MTARGPACLVGALALALAGCRLATLPEKRVVRIVGSDTMLRLTTHWAEAYMRRYPGAVIVAEGGGTARGIASLAEQCCLVAAGSRPLLPEEVRRLEAHHGSLGVSLRVARDALGVYVHPDNPVRSLTLLQTKGLFTGRIGSWHKVGGRNEPVHVVVRSPSSGTQHFFKELVLDEEAYSDRAVVRPTTAGVIAEIRADRTAIGYAGLGWPEGVSAVAVEDVMPSAATASTDAYPLSRYLYLHTAGPPAGAIKSFVDFAVGPEGQRIVAEVGFVPLWPSD